MQLELEKIKYDGGTQSREEIDYEAVHEYSENIDKLPPIVVYHDGATYWLADGFHRYHAHKKLNKEVIECEIIQGSKREAILYSVGANATHGKPRTNADKRKAVLTLLKDEEWATWKQCDVAKTCNVSREFVSRLQSMLRSEGSVTCDRSQVTYTTKHGTVATMNTANIGKTKEVTSYIAPEEEQEQLGQEDRESIVEDKDDCELAAEELGVALVSVKSCDAIRYANSAIYQLQMIKPTDPEKNKGFDLVIEWINLNK
jgi:hypothetical protein